MTASVPDLLAALQGIARSGRLGQPVFLRCQVTAPPERAVTFLAEALAAAAALFEDTPDTLQAAGDKAAGALHAALIFRSGSTVLAYAAPGEEAVDVMLLGNHGTAYGPGGPISLHRRTAGVLTAGEGGETADQFIGLIQRSLAARQPVQWETERDV